MRISEKYQGKAKAKSFLVADATVAAIRGDFAWQQSYGVLKPFVMKSYF